jgi:voltage-gated potassium channel
VLREELRSISALLFLLLPTVTIAGSLMYMLEIESQPKGFTSIPIAMWWTIEAPTTVGARIPSRLKALVSSSSPKAEHEFP